MPENVERPVYLDTTKFDFSAYSPGSEGIVGTVQVPKNQVWRVATGRPLVCSLVAKQTVTVTASSTETKTLDPEAPLVDYLPDIRDGNYTDSANVVGFFDSGSGSKDTLVTGSTAVSWTGNFTDDSDFISEVELEETGGTDKEVDIYTVVRHGQTTIQKRSAGKKNVSQELQTEDSITWAFSNPDDPESNRQIVWDSSNHGPRGVLPPKFYLDLVFYDDGYGVDLDSAQASDSQLEISIPVLQRDVYDDEKPASLRRKIRGTMAEA